MFYILALLAVTLIMIFVPLAIIFWLVGLSVKAIGAMALFALKYLLPFIAGGFIIAKCRDANRGFDWIDYAQHMGVCAGVGLALILTFVNLPAHPEMPTTENIKTVTVSYQKGDETYTESLDKDWYVENLCSSLSNAKFKHSIR